jgi:hypothetical protein
MGIGAANATGTRFAFTLERAECHGPGAVPRRPPLDALGPSSDRGYRIRHLD